MSTRSSKWNVQKSADKFIANGWGRPGVQLDRLDLWEVCDLPRIHIDSVTTRKWLSLNAKFSSRRAALVRHLQTVRKVSIVYDGRDTGWIVLHNKDVAAHTKDRMEFRDYRTTETARQLLSSVDDGGLNKEQMTQLLKVQEIVRKRSTRQ